MTKYKIFLQFDGHRYLGWQKQNQSSPTVQDELERALQVVFKVNIKTTGSGRTDTGVHSLSHYVVFDAPFSIDCKNLVKAINSNLPQDIKTFSAEVIDGNFRPTNNAISREYRYLFTNLEFQPPFHVNYIANISHKLDFDLIRQACELFVGDKDFGDFYCKGSEVNSTVRTIYSLELLEHEADFHGIFQKHYYFRIVGSGFLKQMVRLIVGTLWNVGIGKVNLSELKSSLEEPRGKHLGPVSPACGLYKYHVNYIEKL